MNMASSLAACLRSVGYDMPHVRGVVPLLDMDNTVEALTAGLQVTSDGALLLLLLSLLLYMSCAAPTPDRGVVSCTHEQ